MNINKQFKKDDSFLLIKWKHINCYLNIDISKEVKSAIKEIKQDTTTRKDTLWHKEKLNSGHIVICSMKVKCSTM